MSKPLRSKISPILRTNKLTLSGFDKWTPSDYLRDYYGYVEQDERYTLRFLVDEFKKIRENPIALEFGAGPTLHHILPLSPYVAEIHVADYLKTNLSEIKKWQQKEVGMHNWKPFTELILKYEGNLEPTDSDIERREELTRQKITKYILCDASNKAPLLGNGLSHYSFMLSCYCADSATNSREVWHDYMVNILSLLKPGGFFVTAALRDCRYYKVGKRFFPCANLREGDFNNLFVNLDFDMSTVNIMVQKVPEHKEIGYESIILASGFKKSD
ncbi:hypothetical protein A2716_00340 [candidate division WWE3 bacterium RIFCSPHIGHO2_01_FULL_40_23]|uniref:Methyltransferase n=1 Tax=candidate division WWE3 bacterium RIFCSPLOWO2_01_FULL_41_18 TaxID=1802625 RepID=A0A1F4VE71_UNCKA|nr:MAG: hypothetical protein A2716_00340 [candidate division WWE3 bacterium RIFCSPHIGHO2_01_FULL_40_23]OGC55445.1 MAG: hypothetical protein A3A78_00610 [candidate division WWE3 bacterium RIFCSPLOWO2_01_FULL_41_18]